MFSEITLALVKSYEMNWFSFWCSLLFTWFGMTLWEGLPLLLVLDHIGSKISLACVY
jgi:hypothetical protein